MTRKRRSLQALFIPSLRNTLLGSSSNPDDANDRPQGPRMRSQSVAGHSAYDYPFIPMSQPATPLTSPTRESPPSFLLDEDPFANLTARAPVPAAPPPPPPPPASALSRPSTPSIHIPRQPEPLMCPSSPLTLSATDGHTRPCLQPTSPLRANGRFPVLSPRVTPATRRPAFRPRPSLPSLDTLAKMNVVIGKKVRKGRVGAGLPFEPWDMDSDQSACSSPGQPSFSQPAPPSLPSSGQSNELHQTPTNIPQELTSIREPEPGSDDFVSDLEIDPMELSDGPEDDTIHMPPPLASRHQDGLLLSGTSRPAPPSLSGSEADTCSQSDWSRMSSSSSSQPSLTRSTSFASMYSFSGSSVASHFRRPSANYTCPVDGDSQHSSTESETDLSSPPDDYFSYRHPTSQPYTNEDLEWDDDRYQFPTFDGSFATRRYTADLKYFDDPEALYQPGTSAGTIRPAKDLWPEKRTSFLGNKEGEMVDGGEGQSSRTDGGYGGSNGGSSSSRNGGGGSSRNYGSSRGGGSQQGSGSGNGGDGRDNNGRPGASSMFSTSSSDETTSSDEDESTDDNVPLAQRIPTALTAQRTIRRQVKEERDQRRKERALRAAAAGVVPPEAPTTSRSRNATLRPGAGDAIPLPPMPSTQEVHPSSNARRPRTYTMPSNTSRPFAPEDLVKKLQNMQVSESASSSHHRVPSSASRGERPRTPGQTREMAHLQQNPLPSHGIEAPRPLRRAKSIQRPDDRVSPIPGHIPPPLPTLPVDLPVPKIGRSLTTTNRPKPQDPSMVVGGKARSVPGNSVVDNMFRSSGDPTAASRAQRDGTKSTRTSSEMERPRMDRPPVPPLPVQASSSSKVQTQQQRIFIGDMQRFNMVELGPTTTAADVISMVEAQGSLKGWVGVGGWMLFEVAQDFGMERPIRSYELLSDIQSSWNKDKMMNTFIIKLTPLATTLSRSAIPSSSPMHSGFVEWESKRGKWSKRYMQLREHSLWLSKREGKDETFLCSLSSFDAYFVTRLHKAPKQYVFAIKSTDNLSYFENSADYLHIFSCTTREGEVWMEKILLARSYVLHQEKNILSKSNNPSGSTSLSRAGTRRGPRPAQQPLLSLPANAVAVPTSHTNVFEPGSLLAKHS
ncbi:hypothetical protein AX16_008044 [Volvariella volvacea WC 439]|nr:hypothetical protein AX16_008044 [Volvariella volvacea WC 439]